MKFPIFSKITELFNPKKEEEAKKPKTEADYIKKFEDQVSKGVQAQVQIKSVIIEKKNQLLKNKEESNSWADKANKILDKVGSGEISEEEGDKFAKEALDEQIKSDSACTVLEEEIEKQQKSFDALTERVNELKSKVKLIKEKSYNVKLRENTANVTLEINKEFSDVGEIEKVNDLITQMEENVSTKEAEASAYDSITNEGVADRQRIEEILNKGTKKSSSDVLSELKSKRASKV
jgi:phage shock protein A